MSHSCSCNLPESHGLEKVADFVLSDCKPITVEEGMVKQASSSKDGNSNLQRVLKEEVAKHPDALFFKAKAIEADVPNNNGDCFGVDELKKSAQTFVGVPFFTNHQNSDIEKAKGKVVYAEWDDKEKAIYVVAFIDRKAYPHLCRGIEQEYVTGVSMGAVCAGTKILMADLSEKNIDDIIPGDYVISHTGNSKKVIKTHNEYLGTKMFSIDLTTYHKCPTLTFDHPLFIIDKEQVEEKKREAICVANHNKYEVRKEISDERVGQYTWRNSSYNPEWKHACEAREGDYILIPSKFSLSSGDSENSDFYYVVGAYLGDGYLRRDRKGEFEAVSFCLGPEEYELAKKITDILKKYSDSSPCNLVCEKRNGLYISYYDRKLANWFAKNVSTGCKDKRIKFPIEKIGDAISLLCGYIDTDGCIVDKTKSKSKGNGFGGIQVSSSNLPLLEDIQSLLISCGFISRISSFDRTPSENSVVKINTRENTLSVGSNASSLFERSIKYSSSGFCSAEIMASKSFITSFYNRKYMACPIKSIEEVEWNEPVYDLTVEDDESYIADGVAVHNCSVEYSLCSICRNKAASQEEYCHHIRNMKGRKFTGQVTDVKTGETRTLKDAPVYEENYGIRFIELSGVVDPACPTCRIKEKFKNDDMLKAAATRCANGLAMFKSSELFEKTASEQDVQKLNQALQILQEIAIKLIQNRQNIEMEFSADIVKILADLQEYVDGLVQAGFGKIPDTAGATPSASGTPDLSQQAMPPAPMPGVEGAAGALGAQPIGAEQPLAETPGQVSGNVGAPLAQAPISPEDFKATTRPAPGGAQKSTTLQRPTSPRKGETSGEEEMRRIPTKLSEEKRKVANTLESDWQEKLQKISNRLRDSIKGDLITEGSQNNNSGGSVMSKITQEAKARVTPMETLENQLDEKVRLHPRTEKVDEVAEEAQLEGKREGAEPNDTEQVLLEEKREDSLNAVVEENQLKSTRKGEPKQETEQAQLDSRRVGNDPNVTLEKMLSNPPTDTPSTRTSSSIKAHVEAAVEVVGKTVTASQSTPDRVIKMAGRIASLSLEDQAKIVKQISSFSGVLPGHDNFKDRVSFWTSNGLQVTSASDKDVGDILLAYCGQATKQSSLNPEMLLRAFAALKSNPRSVDIVTAKVSEIIKTAATEHVDVEDAMNAHIESLSPVKVTAAKKEEKKEDKKDGCEEIESDTSKQTVEAETKALMNAVKKETSSKPTIMIETSFDEMGVPQSKQDDDEYLRVAATTFARGACANLGVKVAAVVNVTVDGESGDVVIAVDTENGSVEIPVGEKDEDEKPEDMEAASDMDANLGAPEAGAEDLTPAPIPETPATPATGAPAPAVGAAPAAPAAPSAGGIGAFTSTNKKVKTAQFGGGAPGAGAAPTDPNAGAMPQDPSAPMSPPPGEGEGISSFTDEGQDEMPGDEEQVEPGSICPICGSTDTETGNKDQAPGQFDCQSCGAKYSFHVNVEVLNPEELMGESGEERVGEEEMKSPKAPSMPVAAEVSLDRDGFKKVAKVQKDVGHVCPACGGIEVEAKGNPSDIQIACKKCKTESEKSVLINVDNPVESVMRVAWTIDPMKRKCSGCREEAKKFAAARVFDRMIKSAAQIEFPEANVRSWIEATYPGVTYVNNGPFKGQNFADTLVHQLKAFGFTKGKYLKRLAEVQAAEDPMDTCVKDHKKKGYTVAEAGRLCNCLKEKYAGEEDENIYMQAFGGDMIDKHILRKMAEYDKNMVKTAEVEVSAPSIGDDDDLAAIKIAPKKQNKETTDMSKALGADVSLFPESASEKDIKTAAKSKECPPDVAKKGDETHTKYVADKEKKVKVEETVADGKGQKPSKNIQGPKVPRGDATMGNEVKPPKEGVDVPSKDKQTDTSSLGQVSVEAAEDSSMKKQAYAEQETMTRKNEETKNPDSTTGDTALDEKPVKEKSPEKVDCMCEKADVEIPCKCGKATINDEQPAATEGPKVPRGDATMGNENPPKAEEPKVPTEVAETDMTFRGRDTVEAERNKQMEKIALARREHAMRFAGQLIERGILKEEELDTFVKDMSALPLDRMKTHVAMLLKSNSKEQKVVTASVALTTPIVKEAETIVEQEEPSLSQKLSKMFTIGGPKNDRHIRMAMAEEDRENEKLNG